MRQIVCLCTILAGLLLGSVVGCAGSEHPAEQPAPGVTDHRVEMKVDKYLDILPAGSPPGMMKMVKAPDGTIYLNTQSSVAERALLKSTDGGNTWSSLLVKFTDPRVWPSQTISGLTVTRDGQLWAVHQAGMIAHGGVYLPESCLVDGTHIPEAPNINPGRDFPGDTY